MKKDKLKKILAIFIAIVIAALCITGAAFYLKDRLHDKNQAYMADVNNPPKALKKPEQWEQTFFDDFDSLDTTKWKIITFKENGNIRRAAYYTDSSETVFTENGKLHISTKWRDGKQGKGWYTAYLETAQNVDKQYNTDEFKGFSQTEGYFEVRCKVPPTYGIWSAFWLMPDNDVAFSKDDIQNSAADGIEIDVMESPYFFMDKKKERNSIKHVLHADGYDSRLKTVASDFIKVNKLYDEFHTYGVLWEGDTYTFYIDGKKSFKTKHVYNDIEMGACKAPEYLLLSTEVGGSSEDGKIYEGLVKDEFGKWVPNWNGDPKKNDKEVSHDFIVDYVRCYQKIK